jgi:hypothetical protein
MASNTILNYSEFIPEKEYFEPMKTMGVRNRHYIRHNCRIRAHL